MQGSRRTRRDYRPRAPGAGCVLDAYARAAQRGRNGRARLDPKGRFTGGAAFVGSEARALRGSRARATFEAAAARAATARRRDGETRARAVKSASTAGEAAMRVHGSLVGTAWP